MIKTLIKKSIKIHYREDYGNQAKKKRMVLEVK